MPEEKYLILSPKIMTHLTKNANYGILIAYIESIFFVKKQKTKATNNIKFFQQNLMELV